MPPLPVLRERSNPRVRERAELPRILALPSRAPHARPNLHWRAELGVQIEIICDGVRDRLNILQYVLGGESKNSPPALFEEFLPGKVGGVLIVVVPTVNFDNKSFLDACKVNYERRLGKLPTEFQAAKAFGPQHVPKKRFGFGLTFTKLARSLGVRVR